MPTLIDHPNHFRLTTLLAIGVLAGGLLGCGKSTFRSNKEIPAGLRERPHAKFKGRLARVWGGDNFEVGDRQQLHYFVLKGVDCPEPGQPFYQESCNHLVNLCSDHEIELEALAYDDFKREIGHAWVETDDGVQVNLAIELLSKGLAWYGGSVFAGSARYHASMEAARAKQIGLWAQAQPIPPWEYWKKNRAAVRGEH